MPFGMFSCVREFYDAVDNRTFDQTKLDSDEIILILKFNGLNLAYFDKIVRDDEDMVSIAVAENASAIQHASASLQLNEDFLQKIYLQNPYISFYSLTVKESRKIAMSTTEFCYVQQFSKEILSDMSVALELVKRSSYPIQYFSDSIQCDSEILYGCYEIGDYIFINFTSNGIHQLKRDKISMIAKKKFTKLNRTEIMSSLKSRILKFTCFAMLAKDVSISFV